MMTMIHGELVTRAACWLRGTKRCHIVLSERGMYEQPDAIGWTRAGHSTLIECKTSVSDFCSDRHKPARRHGGMGRERFYLTVKGLLSKQNMPDGWGLLEACGKIIRIVTKPHVRYLSNYDARSELAVLATECGDRFTSNTIDALCAGQELTQLLTALTLLLTARQFITDKHKLVAFDKIIEEAKAQVGA